MEHFFPRGARQRGEIAVVLLREALLRERKVETWNLVERLVEDAVDLLEREPGGHGERGARGRPLEKRVDFVEEGNAGGDLEKKRPEERTRYQ